MNDESNLLTTFRGLVNRHLGRRGRRIMVVILYLDTFVFLGFGLAVTTSETSPAAWVWWLLFVFVILFGLLMFLTSTALKTSTQNLTEKRTSELDERQRTVLYRVHYRSYKILGGIFLVPLGYAMVAGQLANGDLWLPEKGQLGWLFWFALGFFYIIPMTVAAWTEPDLEPEGEL